MQVCVTLKGMVFRPFWSGKGYGKTILLEMHVWKRLQFLQRIYGPKVLFLINILRILLVDLHFADFREKIDKQNMGCVQPQCSY